MLLSCLITAGIEDMVCKEKKEALPKLAVIKTQKDKKENTKFL
jgi:hypothetical protein